MRRIGLGFLALAVFMSSAASAEVKVYTGIVPDQGLSFLLDSGDGHDGGWGRYSIEAFFSAPTAVFELRAHRHDTHLFDGGFDDGTTVDSRDVVTTHSNPRDPDSLLRLNLDTPHYRYGCCLAGLTYESGLISFYASYDPDAGPVSYRVITTYIAAIPEPATWATMLLGFGAAGILARKRVQASVAA